MSREKPEGRPAEATSQMTTSADRSSPSSVNGERRRGQISSPPLLGAVYAARIRREMGWEKSDSWRQHETVRQIKRLRGGRWVGPVLFDAGYTPEARDDLWNSLAPTGAA